MSFGKKEINWMKMNENNNFKIFSFPLLGSCTSFWLVFFKKKIKIIESNLIGRLGGEKWMERKWMKRIILKYSHIHFLGVVQVFDYFLFLFLN